MIWVKPVKSNLVSEVSLAMCWRPSLVILSQPSKSKSVNDDIVEMCRSAASEVVRDPDSTVLRN